MCASSSTCRWARAPAATAAAGARTTSCRAGAVRHHQRARPGRRRWTSSWPPATTARSAGGRRATSSSRTRRARWASQPAVAPLLQRVQPPAPHGRRQAAPVLVLGRRVRPAHRAALGRRAGRPHRVRAGPGRQARRAPRQGRNRAGNVPNWRLRGTDGLPAVGTCRCCEGPRRAAFARSQGLAYQSTLRPCDPPNSTPLGPSR